MKTVYSLLLLSFLICVGTVAVSGCSSSKSGDKMGSEKMGMEDKKDATSGDKMMEGANQMPDKMMDGKMEDKMMDKTSDKMTDKMEEKMK